MIYTPGRSVRSKLLAIVAASAIALVLTGSAALHFIHRELIDDRTVMVKSITETAVGAAADLQRQVETGKLSRGQAVAMLHDMLHAMRFGANGRDYIFAYSMDGTSISNAGNPSIEGKNLMGMAQGIATAGEAAAETGRDAKGVLAASSATAERSQQIQQATDKFLLSLRSG